MKDVDTNKGSPKQVPYFDGFLVAKDAEVCRLIGSVTRQVIAALGSPSRPSSVARITRQVESIVCNATLNDETAIPLSKRVLGKKDRYRAPVLKESIRPVLNALVELGYIKLELGSKTSEFDAVDDDDEGDGYVTDDPGHTGLSRISVADKLPRIPRRRTDGAINIGRHQQEGERVILKKPKVRGHRGWNLQYEDTDATRRMRSELETISEAIRDRVEYIGDDSRIDESAVFLQRFFIRTDDNEDFTQGGRIFGDPYPWWLMLSSKDRFKDIAIWGDDQLVEVDYAQHAVRTLYGLAGIPPIFDDAYAIPGFEDHREAVKTVLNSMIWAEEPLSRFPKKKGDEPRLSTQFPKGTKVEAVTEAIMKFHQPIAHLFHEDHGYGIQYLESQTMISVLLKLLEAGVTALPYHDAILVAEAHRTLATETMLSAFREVTGVEGVVTVSSASS